MKFRLGIRSKLFFSILLILLLSYSTLIYSTVKTLNATLEEKIGRDLEANLKFAHFQYLARAEQMKYTLLQPAMAPPAQQHLQARDKVWLKKALHRWQKILPFVDLLTIVDSRKLVVARVNGNLAGDAFELGGVLDRAFNGKQPVISTELVPYRLLRREGEVEYSAALTTGEAMMLTVVIPVVTEEGELLGGIVAGDVINRDPHIPYQVQEIFGNDAVVNITQRDVRIASSIGTEFSLPTTLAPQVYERIERRQPFRGETQIGSRLYKTAFEPITNANGEVIGSLSVALPGTDMEKLKRANLRNIMTSAGIGIFLSFGIAYFVARRLARPLRELARGAQNIASGYLDQRVVVGKIYEFALLADSFNKMAAALQERDLTIRNKTVALEEVNSRLQESNELLEKRVGERTAELQMEKGRLEAILTSMAEGVVVTDCDNKVILFNPAAQRIFEMVPFWMLDKPFAEVCESRGFCPLSGYIEEIRNGPDTATVREVNIKVKGKQLKVQLSPFFDATGGFAGVVMSIRDMTLEGEVDRMKSEFISTVSHELKTPLTSMKGSLQLLLSKEDRSAAADRELLEICLRNTDRLIRLINDILDISKIEAGGMEFSFKPDSIAELVAYAVAEIKGFSAQHNVPIINLVGHDLPLVYGDHDRLIQVITNLLANAVKFSPEEAVVTVIAERRAHYVEVSVVDRGEVIQWGDRDKLFKKFQQLEGAETKGSGTGLGLAICKEIIEKHHGKIYYRAGGEGGNNFTFTVPVYEEQ